MDYYEDGSIVSYMKARSVTNEERLQWVRTAADPSEDPCTDDEIGLQVKEIALGLKYLHRRKVPVVHGDVRGVSVRPSPHAYL